jgi:hypothetical protein
MRKGQAENVAAVRPVHAAGALGAIRWVRRQPVTWLAAGILIGIAAALALAARVDSDPPAPAAATLVVGANAPYARISDALRAAHPGDLVLVEAGAYAEQLVVPEGVDVSARAPGSVTLRRDENVPGDWVAIAASGAGTITGFRIESTARAPVTVGLRIAGADRHVQWCDVDGPMRTAVEISDGRGASLESLTIHVSRGPALTLVGASDVRLARSTLVRGGPGGEPALSLKDTTGLTLWRNVFVGYGNELVRGISAAERDALFGSAQSVLF